MSAESRFDGYVASGGDDMLDSGGMKRTDDLAQMCGVSEGKTVLSIGCGYGRSVCCLARKHGCKMVVIDRSMNR